MRCPFLAEDIEGIYCKAVGVNVEYIDGADMDLCLYNQYKNCAILDAYRSGEKIIVRLKDSN